jgi:nucleoside 2-deoxyribosyltransferase
MSKIKSIYIIGSLRNPMVNDVANKLREAGYEGFDDWYSPGPNADDHWRDYTLQRGQTYKEALNSYSAKHVFEFDKFHIDRCDAGLLVQPAGRSGHLELGYMIGKGKPGYILLDNNNPRYDIMLQFSTGIFENLDDFIKEIQK